MRKSLFCLKLAVLLSVLLAPVSARAADSLPMLSTQGTRYVDPSGNPVILKGCNLGNWLMLESWMLGGGINDGNKLYHDQAQLFRVLRTRFGDDRFNQLMDLYRTGYIEPRDFELLKTFGFNVVRLPFDYRLLQSDQPPYALKPDAFRWLDRALGMADAAHVYIILDLHGVPGGQSKQDHTGESGQNHLWKNDTNKQRTIDIWREISTRYKSRSIIAAYDLINEPYGDYKTDERPELANLIPRIAAAIRSTGDAHIVFFPGALNGGVAFYGNPRAAGFTNVAFTEHHYPGLFGSIPSIETQARVLNQEMPIKKNYLDAIEMPYYIGEFNVVMTSMDPNEMLRIYYDRFRDYGWAGTMWSYKLLGPAGGVHPGVWYMVTNAAPLPRLDIHTSSFEDFKNYFSSFATMQLAVNEPLRDALTSATPPSLALAHFPIPPASAPPSNSNPPGWTSTDIGPAVPGSTTLKPDGSIEIYGGGADIHAAADSFRFLSHPAQKTADESIQIDSLLDSNPFAKAGIMARWGDQPNSPMAFLHAFPDGTIALMTRTKAGEAATETALLAPAKFPLQLRLKIDSGRATAFYRDTANDWNHAGSAKVPADPTFRIGVAVCSHVDVALTVAKVRLGSSSFFPSPGTPGEGQGGGLTSLLNNGKFELTDPTNDPPSGWTHSVDAETSATELFQDAPADPGKRYAFTINAQFQPPTTGQDHRMIELRLETQGPDGIIVLNAKKIDLGKLTADWTPLTVRGTTISDHIRATIIISASPQDSHPGKLALKNVKLVQLIEN